MTIQAFGRGHPKTFSFQAPVAKDQDDPVDGTEYTVLDTTKHVRIVSIYAKCTWTVQVTTLTVTVTVDGHEFTYSKGNPETATDYFANISEKTPDPSAGYLDATGQANERAFLIGGKNVKVTIKRDGGTCQNVYCLIKYDKK